MIAVDTPNEEHSVGGFERSQHAGDVRGSAASARGGRR